jgi:hypothetical protein
MARFDPNFHPRFVNALVTYADVKGDSSDIEAEFDALFQRISSNSDAGKALVSASINGKSFGYELTISAEDKFAAIGEALRIIKGLNVQVSYPAYFGVTR